LAQHLDLQLGAGVGQLGQDVAGDQDGLARGPQVLQQRADLDAGPRVQAGRRLVEASLPFVIRVAREYRRWGVPLEDLVQQGNLGLLKAARKYDPEKQCRLITYAVYWIRAEIRDYVVRSYRIVRLGSTRTERRAMRAFRRTSVESPEELAETSGMPLKRAKKLWPLLSGGDVSLDYQTADRGPGIDRVRARGLTPEDEAARFADILGVRERLDVALGADGGVAHPIQAVKPGEKEHAWQVDGITGATISSQAIAGILRESSSSWVPRIRAGLDDFRGPE